jgi:lipopolysaccharide export system permease protein
MIFSKIWERYFVAEFLKTFLLFLLGFYGLYALIDYSVHVNSFNYIRFTDQWKMIVLYYGSEFINRSDVIVPFGLLIATESIK